MYTQAWQLVLLTWKAMLLGTTGLVVAATAGWVVGRWGGFILTRLVAWWVDAVILRIIGASAWWRRAVGIFVNNTTVLAGVLALGRSHGWGWFGVITVGISLGLGLRALSEHPAADAIAPQCITPADRRRVQLGMLLNLLEPPAIVFVIGLSLAQPHLAVDSHAAWSTFGAVIVPLLLVAAGGEALWLGVGRSGDDAPSHPEPTEEPGERVRQESDDHIR